MDLREPRLDQPTPARNGIAALCVGLLAAAFACGPRGTNPDSRVPEAAPSAAAASLPAFDVPSEGEVADGLERYKVVLGDAPIRGPETAPVTIVMYSDFECPYCVRGHQTMGAIAQRYPDKVRFAYKPYPLPIHNNAIFAALAARTAQANGKFWEFHDKLYRQAGLEPETLTRYARESGIDVATLHRDLTSLEYGPEVSRDMRDARRLGVTSTPTFFINGRKLSGAQPIEAFAAVIDDEIATAARWSAQGVPAKEIYDHAIADGYTRVEVRNARRTLDPDGVFPVPIGDSPVSGLATAPVTIVSFADFECPFCARGNATVERVRKFYGDKIRVVHKHTPLAFHSFAFLAARAAVAADQQGKFWEFHEQVYALEARLDEQRLLQAAFNAGMDMKRFTTQMQDLELDKQIEADQRLASALGISGTPAYFINGRPLSGAQPELQFRLIIEEELERAAAELRSGVAPEALYETLTHRPL